MSILIRIETYVQRTIVSVTLVEFVIVRNAAMCIHAVTQNECVTHRKRMYTANSYLTM